MTGILNATAHVLTEEQIADLSKSYPGHKVFNLKDNNPDLFNKLTQTPADREELRNLARRLIDQAATYHRIIFPIGSPAFAYEFAVLADPVIGDRILFAHSVREFVEEAQADGSVKKTNVFKHVKFF